MSSGKKVLNVFGIIFAWLLSIILVLLLIVSPIMMSVTSVATPKNLHKAMLDVDVPAIAEALMEESQMDAESEQMMEYLTTDAAQELYELYVGEVFGVLDSDLSQGGFTEENLKNIVHNNIDELYAIVVQESPELAKLPEAEGKQAVEQLISDNMDQITSYLPSVEEITETFEEDEGELGMAMDILEEVDTIKWSFVGVIVVLSALIFVCRLPGFRGVRWLSTDLFVATGFAGLICAGLSLGATLIEAMVADTPVAELFVGKMLTTFANGVYIRTGVMLVAAVGLLVAYIFIKKNLAKKAACPQVATVNDASAAFALEETADAPAIEAPVIVTEENVEAVEETAAEEAAEENPAEVDV